MPKNRLFNEGVPLKSQRIMLFQFCEWQFSAKGRMLLLLPSGKIAAVKVRRSDTINTVQTNIQALDFTLVNKQAVSRYEYILSWPNMGTPAKLRPDISKKLVTCYLYFLAALLLVGLNISTFQHFATCLIGCEIGIRLIHSWGQRFYIISVYVPEVDSITMPPGALFIMCIWLCTLWVAACFQETC